MRLTTERVSDPGFADRTFVKMRFVGSYTVTFASSGATQYTTIYANGAYQPGSPESDTATPSYWAKYAAAYSYYRTHKSEIVVAVDTISGSAGQGDFKCQLAATTVASPGSSFVENQTPGYREWFVSGAIDANYRPQFVSQQVSIGKLLGENKMEFIADAKNVAAVNAVPTNVADWQIAITPTASLTANVVVKFTVEYLVEFFDRIFLSDTTLMMRQLALTYPKLLPKREGKPLDLLVQEGKKLLDEGKEFDYNDSDYEPVSRSAGWIGPALMNKMKEADAKAISLTPRVSSRK
jgi:hypothetical protein